MVKALTARNEVLNKAIEAQIEEISYQLVLGEQEYYDGAVTYRQYDRQEQKTVSYDAFLEMLKDEAENKNHQKVLSRDVVLDEIYATVDVNFSTEYGK